MKIHNPCVSSNQSDFAFIACGMSVTERSKMEGNRDESEKCLRRAEAFLKDGELEQALKYVNKAERLFPSKRAKGLYSSCIGLYLCDIVDCLSVLQL